MTPTPTPRTRGGQIAAFISITVLATALVSGCADWWTPQIHPTGDTQIGVDPNGANLAAGPELATTITDLPKVWNATAKTDKTNVTVPDPIVADDISVGTASSTLPLGDYTLTTNWSDETGTLLYAQLDGPMTAPADKSPMAKVANSLFASVLGMSATEANTEVQKVITDAISQSTNPNDLSGTTDIGPASIAFTMADGTASFYITPSQ